MSQEQDYYQDYEYLDDTECINQSDTENVDPNTYSSQLTLQEFDEILILEVQERPCLWDQRLDIKMRGINAIRKAWEAVAKVLSMYIYILFIFYICCKLKNCCTYYLI
ncbi:hypothetical protein ALC62_13309 [Cyphomyrmex costatus]|uniref:MADF domain-containing protein n=1 Tax=Cyphomyrmex costatus TaxID=456900 RepID=A0A151IA90_9HYME|nr:hypothetical protein ALC62_13309 [Cyphomyrmex costatus]